MILLVVLACLVGLSVQEVQGGGYCTSDYDCGDGWCYSSSCSCYSHATGSYCSSCEYGYTMVGGDCQSDSLDSDDDYTWIVGLVFGILYGIPLLIFFPIWFPLFIILMPVKIIIMIPKYVLMIVLFPITILFFVFFLITSPITLPFFIAFCIP